MKTLFETGFHTMRGNFLGQDVQPASFWDGLQKAKTDYNAILGWLRKHPDAHEALGGAFQEWENEARALSTDLVTLIRSDLPVNAATVSKVEQFKTKVSLMKTMIEDNYDLFAFDENTPSPSTQSNSPQASPVQPSQTASIPPSQKYPIVPILACVGILGIIGYIAYINE